MFLSLVVGLSKIIINSKGGKRIPKTKKLVVALEMGESFPIFESTIL